MRLLRLFVLCLSFLSTPAIAQTVLYNPTTLAFEHTGYDITTFYRAEFWVAPATGQPLVTLVATADVPRNVVTLGPAGPPQTYLLAMRNVPVFVPFGRTYVLRLLACVDAGCSPPSEVTREQVRYTYCRNTDTTVRPLTISHATQTEGTANGYVPVTLTISAVQPVTAVAIQLVGSGQPAAYFTGVDMRGTIRLSLGPLPRAGRYLMNISASDQAGCSASQATQYLQVR